MSAPRGQALGPRPWTTADGPALARKVILRSAGWIYVVRSGDRIKIGYSRNVRLRIQKLAQVAGPLELLASFPGTRDNEAAFHRRFQSHRLFGEWFQATARVVRWARLKQARHREPG